jgi:hypothetical protein
MIAAIIKGPVIEVAELIPVSVSSNAMSQRYGRAYGKIRRTVPGLICWRVILSS